VHGDAELAGDAQRGVALPVNHRQGRSQEFLSLGSGQTQNTNFKVAIIQYHT
jgi:hypothetical protein